MQQQILALYKRRGKISQNIKKNHQINLQTKSGNKFNLPPQPPVEVEIWQYIHNSV